jgi:hypothetical protein
LILALVACCAHYLVFPQETRSILISFSGYEKHGRLYTAPGTEKRKTDSLCTLIKQATERINDFFGKEMPAPTFIYCNTEAAFHKFSVSPTAPAVTYLKFGTYIVLGQDGLDLDIISHELSHAALYDRIGFYRFNYVIPSWFKHGLAMQNDYRDYYSTDTLKVRTNNFKDLPDIKSIQSDKDFYKETREQVMLHYMAAKYEVGNWYNRGKLDTLIASLNASNAFKY